MSLALVEHGVVDSEHACVSVSLTSSRPIVIRADFGRAIRPVGLMDVNLATHDDLPA